MEKISIMKTVIKQLSDNHITVMLNRFGLVEFNLTNQTFIVKRC